MLSVALVLVLLPLLACVAWRHWGWGTRNKEEPPPLPGALPLIGHLHHLAGNSIKLWNTVKMWTYYCLKAGGAISVYFGPKVLYLVTDPDDCLKIANTCLQKDRYYDFGKPWFGEGLITAELSIYKVHRKLLNPAFSQAIIDGFTDVFNKQARRLLKSLEVEVGKGPFDHFGYLLPNGLETICLTAMAIDFSNERLLNNEYLQATEKIFPYIIERFKKPWLYSDIIFNWSSLKRKQDECLKILHNMSNTVLKKRKMEFLNNKKYKTIDDTTKDQKFRPFMDLILELSIEKGAFTDREVREHVDTILFSGYDTSATILMYTMLLVGSYPKVQDNIFEELYDVFGDDDRDVTKQDLSRLVYLEAVLKESMRIYPLAPLIMRHIDQDIKLRNCTLSKGRSCFLSVFGVHRHPVWGPDAEEFKPERWLDPTKLPACAAAFGGFGMGRRLCAGKLYALTSMKITLAHVFRHYRVSGNHLTMTTTYNILLKPVSGHHVTIEKKKNSTI